MIFEGDKGVIGAIKEKKRLMDAGLSHEHIKPVLIIDGGLMKGAYGVGGALALEELGYTEVFDNVVGISSGAPSAAYFTIGEVNVGSAVLWERCCSKKFLNMWRFWNQVNTDYFMSALREEGGSGLKAQKVLEARTKIYFGVANFQTGEPKLIHPTSTGELFTALQASILMPNVSKDIIHLDNIRYADGGFTKPHVLELVRSEMDFTHLLMITNQDHIEEIIPNLPLLERFLNHTLFRWRMPHALRFAAHERWKERMKAVARMKEQTDVSCALVWGDRSIRSMERDQQVVKEVVEKSRLWWRKLLEE